MPRKLQGVLQATIERLCREGDRHADAGEHAEALACFVEAWEQVPEPREAYEATAPILRGLTRVLRERHDLSPGLDALLGGRRTFTPPPSARG